MYVYIYMYGVVGKWELWDELPDLGWDGWKTEIEGLLEEALKKSKTKGSDKRAGLNY
jgi:hypothetical protein